MSEESAQQVGDDDAQRGQGGHRHGRGARGRRRGRQDRHRRGQPPGPQRPVVHRLHRPLRRRRRVRARAGRHGRHGRRAVAKAASWRRSASRMHGVERDTVIDGRYRVLKRLGSGGMADVYCAEDTQLGRQVALKLLYRRFAEDARVRRALPPRGLERRRPPAPEHRRRLRPRRVGRHLLHRDGVPGGQHAQAARPRARRAAARRWRSTSRSRCCAPRASPTSAGSCTATSSRTT